MKRSAVVSTNILVTPNPRKSLSPTSQKLVNTISNVQSLVRSALEPRRVCWGGVT